MKRPDRILQHLIAVCLEGEALANKKDLKERTAQDDITHSWLTRPPARHRRWLAQRQE